MHRTKRPCPHRISAILAWFPFWILVSAAGASIDIEWSHPIHSLAAILLIPDDKTQLQGNPEATGGTDRSTRRSPVPLRIQETAAQPWGHVPDPGPGQENGPNNTVATHDFGLIYAAAYGYHPSSGTEAPTRRPQNDRAWNHIHNPDPRSHNYDYRKPTGEKYRHNHPPDPTCYQTAQSPQTNN